MARRERPVDPAVQADLDAVDAALRGESLPEDLEGLEDLVAAVQANRPAPEDDYVRSLDSWVEGGLQPESRPGLGRGEREPESAGLLERLGFRGRRPWLPVAAGAATLLIVVSVAVSQIGGDDGSSAGSGGGESAEDSVAQQTVPGDATGGEAEAPSDAAPVAPGEGIGGPIEFKPVTLRISVPASQLDAAVEDALDVTSTSGGLGVARNRGGSQGSSPTVVSYVVAGEDLDRLISDLSALGSDPELDVPDGADVPGDAIGTLRLEIIAE